MLFAEIYQIEDPVREAILKFGEIKFLIMMACMASFTIALLSSLLDILVLRRLVSKRSLGTLILIDFFFQVVMINTVIGLMIKFYHRLLFVVSNEPTRQPTFGEVVFFVTFLVVAIAFSKFIIEINRKIGVGNLWKVLTGRFYKPHEEELIFMFVDLKNATSTAEKLGHLKFSSLLQDCFRVFSVVDRYRANIYQYVGDEAVIFWRPRCGFKNENVLRAFFAFHELIEKRADYYLKEYGIKPYFKAGANIGPVVITEVGEIKREITYHGDTINTASRIQDKCNELGAQLLIPKALYEVVKENHDYGFENLGCYPLKGKEKEVELYRVTKK
jgi:adenylate cyclase